METVPLMMRFIRADIRTQNAPLLTLPQVRSLAFLERNPGASLTDVAEHLGVTRATASSTVERLVKDALVERHNCPEERRRISLTLTAVGKERLQKVREITCDRIAGYLERLSEEQIQQVEAGLTLLKHVFEQSDIFPYPR